MGVSDLASRSTAVIALLAIVHAARDEVREVPTGTHDHDHGTADTQAIQLAHDGGSVLPPSCTFEKGGQGHPRGAAMHDIVEPRSRQQDGGILNNFEPYAHASNVSASSNESIILQHKVQVGAGFEHNRSHDAFDLEDAAVTSEDFVERQMVEEGIIKEGLSLDLNASDGFTSGSDRNSLVELDNSSNSTEVPEGSCDNHVERHPPDNAHPRLDSATKPEFELEGIQSATFSDEEEVEIHSPSEAVHLAPALDAGSLSLNNQEEISDSGVSTDDVGTKVRVFFRGTALIGMLAGLVVFVREHVGRMVAMLQSEELA